MSRRFLALTGAGTALLTSAVVGIAGTAGAAPSSPAVTTRAVGCASSVSRAQAARVAESRVPRFAGHAWTTLPGANHYDTCSDLSWIDLSISGSTGSSPHQIALFHRGHFLGTATAKAYGLTPTVNRLSASSIQVTYHWLKAGDIDVNPRGKTYARFTWNTSSHKVVMTGHVPPVEN